MSAAIRWPLTSNVIRRGSASNTFGMVRHNADGTARAHQGWDFYAALGTAVHAICNGSIDWIKNVPSGDHQNYGNSINQKFMVGSQTYFAFYAHLQCILVKNGDAVSKGQVIGYTGNTGNAYSMKDLNQHLHFEIRTQSHPGRGLAGRVSPYKIYRQCPLHSPVSGA